MEKENGMNVSVPHIHRLKGTASGSRAFWGDHVMRIRAHAHDSCFYKSTLEKKKKYFEEKASAHHA